MPDGRCRQGGRLTASGRLGQSVLCVWMLLLACAANGQELQGHIRLAKLSEMLLPVAMAPETDAGAMADAAQEAAFIRAVMVLGGEVAAWEHYSSLQDPLTRVVAALQLASVAPRLAETYLEAITPAGWQEALAGLKQVDSILLLLKMLQATPASGQAYVMSARKLLMSRLAAERDIAGLRQAQSWLDGATRMDAVTRRRWQDELEKVSGDIIRIQQQRLRRQVMTAGEMFDLWPLLLAHHKSPPAFQREVVTLLRRQSRTLPAREHDQLWYRYLMLAVATLADDRPQFRDRWQTTLITIARQMKTPRYQVYSLASAGRALYTSAPATSLADGLDGASAMPSERETALTPGLALQRLAIDLVESRQVSFQGQRQDARLYLVVELTQALRLADAFTLASGAGSEEARDRAFVALAMTLLTMDNLEQAEQITDYIRGQPARSQVFYALAAHAGQPAPEVSRLLQRALANGQTVFLQPMLAQGIVTWQLRAGDPASDQSIINGVRAQSLPSDRKQRQLWDARLWNLRASYRDAKLTGQQRTSEITRIRRQLDQIARADDGADPLTGELQKQLIASLMHLQATVDATQQLVRLGSRPGLFPLWQRLFKLLDAGSLTDDIVAINHLSHFGPSPNRAALVSLYLNRVTD